MGTLQLGSPPHLGHPNEESSAETRCTWEGGQTPPFWVAQQRAECWFWQAQAPSPANSLLKQETISWHFEAGPGTVAAGFVTDRTHVALSEWLSALRLLLPELRPLPPPPLPPHPPPPPPAPLPQAALHSLVLTARCSLPRNILAGAIFPGDP